MLKWSELVFKTRTKICQWGQRNKLESLSVMSHDVYSAADWLKTLSTDCIASFWKDSFSLRNVKKRAAEERQIRGLSACISVRFAQKLIALVVCRWSCLDSERKHRTHLRRSHSCQIWNWWKPHADVRTGSSSRCWSAGVHYSFIRSDPDQCFTVVQVRYIGLGVLETSVYCIADVKAALKSELLTQNIRQNVCKKCTVQDS